MPYGRQQGSGYGYDGARRAVVPIRSRNLGRVPHRPQPGAQRGCLFLAGAAFLILALLVCVIAFLIVPACSKPEPAEVQPQEKPFVESEPHVASSTPKEEWKQGEMPYLYQFDPEWADVEYSGGPIWEQGCGPTSLAMVYIYLTGNTDMGPVEMAQFATENGYSTDQNGSAWTLMSEGAAQLGLDSTELGADASLVVDELEAGNPVVCIMAPGDFTKVGHFMVLSGLDENGKVVLHDPNSVVNSHVTWDAETIVSQANNIWSFSLM